jgi:hypothetical protein
MIKSLVFSSSHLSTGSMCDRLWPLQVNVVLEIQNITIHPNFVKGQARGQNSRHPAQSETSIRQNARLKKRSGKMSSSQHVCTYAKCVISCLMNLPSKEFDNLTRSAFCQDDCLLFLLCSEYSMVQMYCTE